MRVANTTLHKEPNFLVSTEDIKTLKDPNSVDLFDQNGYHLTKAEQAFLGCNGYQTIERRHEDCMRYDWMLWDKKDGAHINHSDIFERKGFSSDALEQLYSIAPTNPMLYKLIKMKPKWGIDISIDYVSPDAVYEQVMEKKLEIEEFLLNLDWDDVAKDLWKKKDDWFFLDFFEQTKWKTDYFNLSPEKFKNVIWDS
mgnify:CR=1 FL=1